MADPWLIRDAEGVDGEACAKIYRPYVAETALSFEVEPPTAAEMAQRIAAAVQTHAWLVLERDARVIGYAYACAYGDRAAYRWSCTTSIYLEPGLRRSGAGRALYSQLFTRLAARGYRRVFAGITMPNEASLGLHRAMGFRPVGTFEQVGWKRGSWHDVAWLQVSIGDDGAPFDLV